MTEFHVVVTETVEYGVNVSAADEEEARDLAIQIIIDHGDRDAKYFIAVTDRTAEVISE